MEQAGEYDIPASREVVWTALNDPEVLGRCITGCQEVTQLDEQHFNVKVKAKVGPVSATFQAELELGDLNPPESYTIKGGVKGGAAGFAKGDANVSLTEVDSDNTRLTYQVKASVGGKLAQVGSRLVDGAARKMADEFFAAFRDHLVGPSSSEESASVGVETSTSNTAPDSGPSASTDVSAQQTEVDAEVNKPRYESSGGSTIWVIAFVVLALAIIFAI